MEAEGHRSTEDIMKRSSTFFAWLRTNLDRVFFDEAVQRTLTNRLAEIDPRIRWEVGPYGAEMSFFAFSPNLNLKLLPLTEALAKGAPDVAGWIFLSSKPRKQWKSRVIETKDAEGRVDRYNIDMWAYYLTSFNEGEFFDVNLVPYGCEDKPLDDLKYAASLFVEFELGERMFIEFIDQTNIVLPSELNVCANKIENLHDQILQELSKMARH